MLKRNPCWIFGCTPFISLLLALSLQMQTATWFMACDTRSGGRHTLTTLSLLLREKPGGVLFGHISNNRFVKERICMSLQRWEDICDLGPPTTWATVGSCLLSVHKEFLTVGINLRNGQASSYCLQSPQRGCRPTAEMLIPSEAH